MSIPAVEIAVLTPPTLCKWVFPKTKGPIARRIVRDLFTKTRMCSLKVFQIILLINTHLVVVKPTMYLPQNDGY